MASSLEEIEADIRAAVSPGFRNSLLARGEARAVIWREGVLAEGSPEFSQLLTYDLLSYGYSLLGLGLRLRELSGDDALARLAFENAAGAIEAVIAKGDPQDHDRGFHRVITACAYHLGRFSARAFSLLNVHFAEANISPIERSLGLLVLRRLDELQRDLVASRLEGPGTDDNILAFFEEQDSPAAEERDLSTDDDGASYLFDGIDRALADNFMASLGTFLLAMERGERFLVDQARARLQIGLEICGELNLVPQWWAFKLAIHLLDDLWTSSFHNILPLVPTRFNGERWAELRELFIALLHSRGRAEIELWPSQLEGARRAVDPADDLVVSLPTSAGKTRIAELCILRCLSLGKRVVFVTPLRALSAQTETTLQRTFVPLGKSISTLYGSIGASGFDEDVLRARHIVVATPEKLDFALRNDPSLIDDVGLVVLDEGHMIGPGEREVRYEVQIQRLLKRPDADQRRIVCLSAILPDGEKMEDFVKWLRRDRAGGSVRSEWRPTRLRFGEVRWREDHARLDVTVGEERSWVEKFLEVKKASKGKRKKPFPSDQRELCLASAWRLIEDGQSVLIYCPERRSVDPYAKVIVELNRWGLLPSVLEGDTSRVAVALSIGQEWLGSEHPILQCLKLGVAIHHGALPTAFRKEIERLLREGVLRLTVSSPTLAQGLNLSATCIIFHGLTRDRARLEASEFKNVIGRAGRAYVDTEGLVLCPMFDHVVRRWSDWRKVTSEAESQEMESGLVRLVAMLMQRMYEKLGKPKLDELLEYVANNAAAWDFPELGHESPEQSVQASRRWQQRIASLDTAILSLLGDQEIADADIEAKLDEILNSSLWDRRLRRKRENTRRALKNGLVSRAKFMWARSTPPQRRGYFLAGIGFDTGQQLDRIAASTNDLLVQANGAVQDGDAPAAVTAITKLAELIFKIEPFVPDPFPADWKKILRRWLTGEQISGDAEVDTETIRFVEGGLVYRLPWGMEAVRVRAVANSDIVAFGATLDDFEVRVAVPAVETGTLNRSAAILMQAGFASRLAAIKVVQDTAGDFQNTTELAVWLKSERVEKLTTNADWPTVETAEMWKGFRENFTPPEGRTWKKFEATVDASWQHPPQSHSSVQLVDDPEDGCTLILSPDLELMGKLTRKLNAQRRGSTLAAVNAGRIDITYLGPDRLFAA